MRRSMNCKLGLYLQCQCEPNTVSLGHQRSLIFYIATDDILATSF